ncbi:MAG TPA: copper resistance protein CopC [Nocardioidaceae bacterium]|nr:copper resistance protein CopC [Nocardioidaceae bacterium]
MRGRALLAVMGCLLVGQIVLAGPVFAHAELVSTTPTDGQRLQQPPAEVTLTFTEQVGLIEDSVRLVDLGTEEEVTTPEPTIDENVVHWPMPADLPRGAYLVSWRVTSGDTHPIAGGFSFGIGAEAEAEASEPIVLNGSWQVITARWVGYLGFAAVAGTLVFAVVCWPPGRSHVRVRQLLNAGLLAGIVATLVGLLLQGPYVAGVSATRLLSPDLMADTAHTAFGGWMQLRLYLYLALAAVLWGVASLQLSLNRWIAGLGVVALAITFSGTGHAAASGFGERAVNSVHMLCAGIWVGGLATGVVLATGKGDRPSLAAFGRFSRVAMFAVLALVLTGTISSLVQLDAFDQLWQSRYGQLLLAKLVLVIAALTGALVSRGMLQRSQLPWGPLRFEAGATAVVLGATALLTLTAPPASVASETAGQRSSDATSSAIEVSLSLEQYGSGSLVVTDPTTADSTLRLQLVDADGGTLRATSVTLKATLPARDLGPLDVGLTQQGAGWVGDFTFPFSGRWTLALSVGTKDMPAVVTGGTLDIS